ncbi:IPT/TIG domain-containing protein, partial [Escherichia coli]|uniref:IPT/TIG domain-containing protein n=1 Tax=Escherichia coli TaxID=562 RepID=UPI0034D69675
EAKTDDTWPEFYSIEPERATPSTVVTTTGRNFVENMIIVIDEPCTNCVFVNSSVYTCNIAPRSAYTNPKHLLGSHLDV